MKSIQGYCSQTLKGICMPLSGALFCLLAPVLLDPALMLLGFCSAAAHCSGFKKCIRRCQLHRFSSAFNLVSAQTVWLQQLPQIHGSWKWSRSYQAPSELSQVLHCTHLNYCHKGHEPQLMAQKDRRGPCMLGHAGLGQAKNHIVKTQWAPVRGCCCTVTSSISPVGYLTYPNLS